MIESISSMKIVLGELQRANENKTRIIFSLSPRYFETSDDADKLKKVAEL